MRLSPLRRAGPGGPAQTRGSAPQFLQNSHNWKNEWHYGSLPHKKRYGLAVTHRFAVSLVRLSTSRSLATEIWKSTGFSRYVPNATECKCSTACALPTGRLAASSFCDQMHGNPSRLE